MSKVVNKQSKKNLRQRFLKMHASIRNNSKYSVGFIFKGSLAKGSGEVKHKVGDLHTFDLDVDLTINSKDSDSVIFNDIYSAIKKSLREHEKISKKERVIRVSIVENGYSYNFDLAIKRYGTSELIRPN